MKGSRYLTVAIAVLMAAGAGASAAELWIGAAEAAFEETWEVIRNDIRSDLPFSHRIDSFRPSSLINIDHGCRCIIG